MYDKKYEVLGKDLLTGESYPCGEFYTRKEAKEFITRMENLAQYNEDIHREEFQIVQIPQEVIKQREEEQERHEAEKRKDAEYDTNYLMQVVDNLRLSLLGKCESGEGKSLISAIQNCRDSNNCFKRIELCVESLDNGTYVFRVRVDFRERKHFGEGYISQGLCVKTFRKMCLWLKTRRAKDAIIKHTKTLIGSFYTRED